MQINDFFNNIKNRKIAFVGMGISHIGTAKMFKRHGLDVSIFDKKLEKDLNKDIVKELKDLSIKLFLGIDYEKFTNFDIIFRTPGMDFHNPLLKKARKLGKVVTSEMEVFFNVCPCKIIAVTGSDGKTTTTTLIYNFLKENKKNVHIGGNIGEPLLYKVEEIKKDDICVVELSSFQLISMSKGADIAVITNISENHLDVHKTMKEYIKAKKNIFIHQDAFSKTILNYKDEVSRSFVEEIRGKLVFSNGKNDIYPCCFLRENKDIIYKDSYAQETKFLSREQIKLKGEHNIENFMSAISAVIGLCSIDSIKKVAEDFKGVKHRLEFVRELDDVKFYNDSIASTPTRVIAGLNVFEQKVIMISGGYDKNLSFEALAQEITKKAKSLILLGESSLKIETYVKKVMKEKNCDLKIFKEKNMENAVKKAKEISQKGDVVVLAPACASFDMYDNFEKRGEHFKQIVMDLEGH